MNWWYLETDEKWINLDRITSIRMTEDGQLMLAATGGFADTSGGGVWTENTLIIEDPDDADELLDYLRSLAPLRQRERWQREQEAQS